MIFEELIKSELEIKEQFQDKFSNNETIPRSFKGWKIKLVDEKPGREGGGEDIWFVFSATKNEVVEYYKVPGWYYSYDGSTYCPNNFYPVKPVEKVITVWERY